MGITLSKTYRKIVVKEALGGSAMMTVMVRKSSMIATVTEWCERKSG